eukprot:TRINITY_DN4202_c0_g1_i1.p1 TRINITY_DN4202_c0_g1~~TRINITY_DN4202_c0_g1_i1.p1  ORF type:complete len:838 (-),score=227.94 TRINITY_DN4202_c0_g1_i1:118-2631(-)
MQQQPPPEFFPAARVVPRAQRAPQVKVKAQAPQLRAPPPQQTRRSATGLHAKDMPRRGEYAAEDDVFAAQEEEAEASSGAAIPCVGEVMERDDDADAPCAPPQCAGSAVGGAFPNVEAFSRALAAEATTNHATATRRDTADSGASEESSLRAPAGELDVAEQEASKKLGEMSVEEVAAAQREIRERLDPSIIAFLQKRGAQKQVQPQGKPTSMPVATSLAPCAGGKQADSAPAPTPELEWTTDVQPPEHRAVTCEGIPADKLRLDFEGNPVPPAADIPTAEGLHHHGNDQWAAGYTICELCTLAQSSVHGQQALACRCIANVVNRVKEGKLPAGVFGVLEQQDVAQILLAAMGEGQLTVVAAATHAMHALLVDPREQQLYSALQCGYGGFALLDLSISTEEEDEDDDADTKKTEEEKGSVRIKTDMVAGLLLCGLLKNVWYAAETAKLQDEQQAQLFAVLCRCCRHSAAAAATVRADARVVSLLHRAALGSINASVQQAALRAVAASTAAGGRGGVDEAFLEALQPLLSSAHDNTVVEVLRLWTVSAELGARCGCFASAAEILRSGRRPDEPDVSAVTAAALDFCAVVAAYQTGPGLDLPLRAALERADALVQELAYTADVEETTEEGADVHDKGIALMMLSSCLKLIAAVVDNDAVRSTPDAPLSQLAVRCVAHLFCAPATSTLHCPSYGALCAALSLLKRCAGKLKNLRPAAGFKNVRSTVPQSLAVNELRLCVVGASIVTSLVKLLQFACFECPAAVVGWRSVVSHHVEALDALLADVEVNCLRTPRATDDVDPLALFLLHPLAMMKRHTLELLCRFRSLEVRMTHREIHEELF